MCVAQGSDHNTSKHPELDGMPRCCRIATHDGTSGLLQTHAAVLADYGLCDARLVARLDSSSDAYRRSESVTGTMMPFLACLLLPRLREINEPRAMALLVR